MKVAIFDFDGTLFPKETVPYLFKQYGKLGYSRVKQAKVYLMLVTLLAKYKLNSSLTKEFFRHEAVIILLRLFDDMDKKELDEFFRVNSEDIIKILDKDVVKELKEKKEEGYKIVVLSGCFEMLLSYIGDYLEADKIIGTKLHFIDEDGLLDFNKDISMITGPVKVTEFKKEMNMSLINLEDSVAYGDSIYDKHVFDIVGNSVAVNPDKLLKELAKERSYRILKTQN